MTDHKPQLYRWERSTKPRVYSRSQNLTTEDDVQQWVKKVEEASNRAAAAAFGTKYTPAGRSHGRASALATVENVHQHDAAYQEAKDLLSQWMSDTVNLDEDDGVVFDDDDDDDWRTSKKPATVKSEWDRMLEENDIDYVPKGLAKTSHYDAYSLLDTDESEVVGSIMSGLMEKDLVKDDFLEDLGLDDKHKRKVNPTLKMNMRHQQVKENREKRQKELEKKKRDQQSKKEAEFKARQMIKKEESDKARLAKVEEQAIQQEMTKIRKEFDEKKQREHEKKLREQRAAEEKARAELVERERLQAVEESAKEYIRHEDDEKRRRITQRVQEMQARRITQNLKLQHTYFRAWYDHVVQCRIAMGRARAMADFRLLLKTWSGWKRYVREQHTQKETDVHTEEVKLTTRKQTYASEFFKRRLLRKCWIAWQLYMEQEKLAKAMEEEKSNTRSKMAAFLQAAATGQLANGETEEEADGHTETKSAREQLDGFFEQTTKPWPSADTARSDLSTQRPNSASRSNTKPTQPWQLTRKHVHMSTKKISELVGVPPGQNEDIATPTSTDGKDSRKPREKKPFVPAVMEHRHAAQQKILETQQKQIQEQQRLIEELQYLQRQQLLQQQLTNQHLAANPQGAPPIAHLQDHINKLQQQLVNVTSPSPNTAPQDTNRSDGPPTLSTHRPGTGVNDENLHIPLSTSRTEVFSSRTDSSTRRENSTARTESSLNTHRAASSISGTSSRPVSAKVSTPENPRHAQFQKGMEARAAERARIKQEREEKRKQAEAEKLAALQAREEEVLREQEEEKQNRIEAYREKKRLEKQQQIDKQRQAERMTELLKQSEIHYKKALLKYRGWWPWTRLMQLAAEKRQQAAQHHTNTLLRKVLVSWHTTVHVDVQRKAGLADSMQNYILVRRCFGNWKKFGESQLILEKKATLHYQGQLKVRFIAAWHDYAEDQKIAMWRKERAAKEHNVWRLKKKCFHALHHYPTFIKEEAQRERRKADLRQKVMSLLPDYEVTKKSIDTTKSSID